MFACILNQRHITYMPCRFELFSFSCFHPTKFAGPYTIIPYIYPTIKYYTNVQTNLQYSRVLLINNNIIMLYTNILRTPSTKRWYYALQWFTYSIYNNNMLRDGFRRIFSTHTELACDVQVFATDYYTYNIIYYIGNIHTLIHCTWIINKRRKSVWNRRISPTQRTRE